MRANADVSAHLRCAHASSAKDVPAGNEEGESNGTEEEEERWPVLIVGRRTEWTNQKNSRWTSVDRSTEATLSTYNTWIQLSRLQKIYHFQSLKLEVATEVLTLEVARMQ